MTEEEFIYIESIYYGIEPCVNVIQAWNKTEYSPEIKLALDKLLPAMKKFKTFLSTKMAEVEVINQNIVEKDEI